MEALGLALVFALTVSLSALVIGTAAVVTRRREPVSVRLRPASRRLSARPSTAQRPARHCRGSYG